MARHQLAPGLNRGKPSPRCYLLLEQSEALLQLGGVHLLENFSQVAVTRFCFLHHLRPLHLPLGIASPISLAGSGIGGMMARMTGALTVWPVTVSGGRKRAPFVLGGLNFFTGVCLKLGAGFPRGRRLRLAG